MDVLPQLYCCIIAFSLLSPCTAWITNDLKDVKAKLNSLDSKLYQQGVFRHQENEAIDYKLDKIILKLENIQKSLLQEKASGSNSEPTARQLLAQEETQVADQKDTCSRRPAYSPTLTHVVLWDNIQALCDTDTDCGGWVIIQRRSRGDVSFYRGWTDYKRGFGTLTTDFWLGLDTIHNLTSQGYTELRIDMTYEETRYFAHYSNFSVAPASSSFQLSLGQYYGTAGDNLKFHNGSLFSTFDVDNDKHTSNCAKLYHGAWWFANCYHSNLNGLWASNSYSGVVWRDLDSKTSLSFTEMKLRRP